MKFQIRIPRNGPLIGRIREGAREVAQPDVHLPALGQAVPVRVHEEAGASSAGTSARRRVRMQSHDAS